MIELNKRFFRLLVYTTRKKLPYSEIIKLSGPINFLIHLAIFKIKIDSSNSFSVTYRKIQNNQFYTNFIPFPSMLLPETRTFCPKYPVYSKLNSSYVLTFLTKKKLISTEELNNTAISIIKKEIEEYW